MDGLLQLMERRPEKLRPGAIATLREQVARISTIVRRMTSFAHPGEGEWQVKPLNDVVEKATEVLRFDPRWKKAVVATELSPDMPAVRMLPEGVQQVVINLVINALDAMEQVGEPRLFLRTFHKEGFCALEVTDNGHGISKENKAHLFEPFFTTKPVGKGTGLGLSITYTILKTHGGKIDVQSTPGQGARFLIRFPAVASPVRTAPHADAPLVPSPPVWSPLPPGEG
jgi:two-component system NtrC family sensor kinase